MKLSIILAVLFAFSAFAEEQSDSTSESRVKLDGNSKKGKDIDQEITNARMRVNSGSKSRYSASLNVGYSAGPLSEPFGKIRPQLSKDSSKVGTVFMSGSASFRYRIDKAKSVSVGPGFYIYNPFHGPRMEDVTDANGNKVLDEDGEVAQSVEDKFSVADLNTTFSNSFKYGATQNRSIVSLDFGTSQGSQDRGKLGQFDLGHTVLRTVDNSKRLTVGISAYLTFYGFEARKSYSYKAGVAAYPFAEYGLTDSLSLRTVYGGMRNLQLRSNNKWVRNVAYQSIGLGISASRDIYVYPSIQINYDRLTTDATNVGVSTSINAF